MHKLLERQLKRHFGSLDTVPAALKGLLEDVERSYAEAESDRRFVEHSLELTSQELMQRNADLRAKQRELQVIFDSVPAFIIYKDAHNRILRLNGSAATLFGAPAASLEGKDTAELLPKEVADKLYEDDLLVLQSGKPRLGIVESHPTADGKVHWVRTDKVPYLDETGKVVGVVVFSVDITERKEAEAALRHSEERHRLIVETATEGIWTLDTKMQTTFANIVMAKMLGTTPQEMDGRSVFDFIPPEERELGRQKLQELMAGKGVALDFRFRRKDGSDLWAQASAAPMLDRDGKVVGALGMMTDITQRRKAEADIRLAYERLQQVDRERMQFLNNAAHELGTPLTPIKLQMRLLEMSVQKGDEAGQRKAVEILDRNFERLTHLVKDLLDSARLQASSLRLHHQRTDLRDVVYGSVETYLAAAQEAGVDLRVDTDAPLLPVRIDAGRIGQVLDNLLSNAVKFTPRGGRISVELSSGNGNARVHVKDSGSGIKPEDLARLFKPFSQVHDTMQQTRGGTGLGLYVSRGIIEAHGGRIQAESGGPERGSCFWFELPLDAEGQGVAEDAAAAA